MPTDSLATRPRSPQSIRETSFADSSPSAPSPFASLIGQRRGLPMQGMSQSTGTSSMTEGSMRNEYNQPLNDLSHLPIGTVPRILPPDLMFPVPASADSPLYSSSGSSCYSPASDYPQPPISTPQFLTPDTIHRPQSATLETGFQNHQLFTPPLCITPTVPGWEQFEGTALGISYDSPCVSDVSSLIMLVL